MARKSFRFCIRAATLLTMCLAPALAVSAQESIDSTVVDTTATATVEAAPAAVKVDTALFVPRQPATFAGDVTNDVNFEEHLHQNPTVALFKSMLVPGLGQLGNRRYFKTVLFAGLETWFIASAVHYGKQANDARDKYLAEDDRFNRVDWYYLYDNKRKNRNKFAWYAGLTIFISMFDAYVDAHLSGSPADSRNDKFSVDVVPSDDGGVAALLSYRF